MEKLLYVFSAIVFGWINLGIASGFLLGVIWLLRPGTRLLLTPRQRVILWWVGWISCYIPSNYMLLSLVRVFPATVRDLITPRTGGVYSIPAYLPGAYMGAGAYNLAAPGGIAVQVELSDIACLILCLVWAVGVVLVLLWMSRGSKHLVARAQRTGELLGREHPFYAMSNWEGEIWLCDDIPTGFVTAVKEQETQRRVMSIFLQRNLSPQRMELVLRHEGNHKSMHHCGMKAIASAGVCIHWWNPVMWMAWFATCRDMELDCDNRTLRELTPAQRREYAHALVELGVGRQLWDAPLCFGECDAQIRVKEVVRWKPVEVKRNIMGWCLTVVMILFLSGGPGIIEEKYLPQDQTLAWSQFLQDKQDLTREVQFSIWREDGWPVNQMNRDVSEIWAGEDSEMAVLALREDGSWWKVHLYIAEFGYRMRVLGDESERIQTPDLNGYRRVY